MLFLPADELQFILITVNAFMMFCKYLQFDNKCLTQTSWYMLVFIFTFCFIFGLDRSVGPRSLKVWKSMTSAML